MPPKAFQKIKILILKAKIFKHFDQDKDGKYIKIVGFNLLCV